MEQQLIPTLYTQINATNKYTLKSFQGEKKQKQQSFFIGDTLGFIYNYEFQKGQIQQVFKSQQNPKEITCIQANQSTQDIYYATGTQIKAINRKGKETFKGETNQTEPIRNFLIEDNKIWTTGQYLINKFEITPNDLKEESYYLSSEKINHFLVGNYTENSFQYMVACGDNTVQIIDNEDLICQFDNKSQITHLLPFFYKYEQYTSLKQAPKKILCGSQNGELIYLNAERQGKQYEISKIWSVKGTSEACIRMFNSFDIQNNGFSDILLAREDSVLEWWGSNINGELEIIWQKQQNESVNGIEGGSFISQDINEFLISTFSGKIIGLQDSTSKFKNIDNKQVFQNIELLEQEIKKLQQTADELERNNPTAITKESFGNEKSFKLNHKMEISTEDATYNLYLDSELAIELVAFQSDLKIDVVDFNNKISVKGTSEEDRLNNNFFLETYRIIEPSVNKLEFKLRTFEGKQGEIKVFVIPLNYQNNAQLINVHIKPLSMHIRTNLNVKEDQQKTLNRLDFEGDFSKNDMHMWIMLMVNDIPTNYEDESLYTFRNALVGSLLICEYQAGKACFKSDSISTICIIKDFVNKEINQRGMNVNVKWNINDDTIYQMFELLKPLFEQHKKNNINCKIIPALKELKLSEEENNFMSDELKQILANGDELLKQFENLPKKIEYLKGIVCDLVFDRASLKDLDNPENKIDTLMNYLDKYQYEQAIKYILL